MDKAELALAAEQPHTNEELYDKQIELLRMFLERNAITQAQYDAGLQAIQSQRAAAHQQVQDEAHFKTENQK